MHRNQKGFTFVELLLAIATIAVIAVICCTPYLAAHSWNSVMPELFGLKEITTRQALQLMTVIAPFLVGSLGLVMLLVILIALTFGGAFGEDPRVGKTTQRKKIDDTIA